MNIPEFIFQYRSVDVFKSIIENKQLRLMSTRHQNDINEIELTNSALEKYIDAQLSETNECERQRFEKIKESFFKNDLNYDCFITCFSEEKDLLSQWRGYADDGRGLSIGFALNEMQQYHSLFVSKVKYVSGKSELISTKSDIFNKVYEKFITRAIRTNKDYLDLMKQMQVASQIKHIGFQEEHEWRIVFILHKLSDIYNYDERHPYNVAAIIKRTYSDDINGYPSGQWEGNSAINTGERYPEIGDFKFHTTRTKLVPYFEFKFEPKLLKEIVIGPNCQINEHDLKCLLECNGFKARDITISKSQLTYRSWI